MYKLRKTVRIEASHQLTQHDGKCARLHGHTWAITIEVDGKEVHPEGPKRGMLVDYYDIKQIMAKHVLPLDHQHLNDHFDYPTSENIARILFQKMAPEFNGTGGMLSRVMVSETQDSAAEYGAN